MIKKSVFGVSRHRRGWAEPPSPLLYHDFFPGEVAPGKSSPGRQGAAQRALTQPAAPPASAFSRSSTREAICPAKTPPADVI